MYGPTHCLTFRITNSTPSEHVVDVLRASTQDSVSVERTQAAPPAMADESHIPPQNADLVAMVGKGDLVLPLPRPRKFSPLSEGDAIVRLDVEDDATQEATQIIDRLPSELRWLSIRGKPATVSRLFRTAVRERTVIVTVVVDGETTADEIANAIEAVQARDGIVNVEVMEGARVEDAAYDRAWCVDTPASDSCFNTTIPDVMVAPDGHVTAAGKRSIRPVWDCGVDSALAEVGLDWSATAFTNGPLLIPFALRMPEPNGRGALVYFPGGTQAMAVWYEEECSRAAFGFHSSERDEYQRWARVVSRRPEAYDFVMPPGFSDVFYGLDQGERKRAPKDGDRETPAFQLAAWMAQGAKVDVPQRLGLRSGSEWSSVQPVLPEDPGSRGYYEKMAALLAMSIEVIAVSRIGMDKRQQAARALTTLGTHDAKRSAKRIAAEAPEIGEPVAKRFRQRGLVKRLKESKDPHLLRRYIGEALDELRAVFAKEEVRDES